jgi:hypothetical protein
MTILRVHLPLTRVLLNSRDQVQELLTTSLHKFQILNKINHPPHSKTLVLHLHYQKKVLAPYLLMLQIEVDKTRLKLRMMHQTS